MQTVPSSPNLYRNSFTYETVKELPPDFAACNRFIGERALLTCRQLRLRIAGLLLCPADNLHSVIYMHRRLRQGGAHKSFGALYVWHHQVIE